ncbi:MAG: polysaccharide deacetylase family protein [Planctomycetes bacterium]|nr:polysaccharide deacetylase family protein [Planctomycetota bacterium]
MNRLLMEFLAQGAGVTGVTAALRRAVARPGSGGGFHVFCYHRIGAGRGPFFAGTPVAAFERQCAFLARHYRVLPLVELVRRSRNGEAVGDAAAITFDDGYRDNLLVALPVLARHRLPATIFLTTAAIGTGEPLWHDRVAWVLERTERRSLELEAGGQCRTLRLETRAKRLAVVGDVCEALKAVPELEKQRAIEALRRVAGVADYRGLARDMLDWDDVRAMTRRGVAFGAHTVNHPILTRLPLEEARSEIRESKRRIEAETGEPCETFAYPNGLPGDFDPAIEALVDQEGFACGASRGLGANPPGGNPYDVRRWTPLEESMPAFALRLAWWARAGGRGA